VVTPENVGTKAKRPCLSPRPTTYPCLNQKRGNSAAPNIMSYHKTYRVQGIPATANKENCDLFLRSILRLIPGGENQLLQPILVHSLGLDPYSSERNPFQVATITFEQVPRGLQDGGNEWTVPIATYNPPTNENIISSVTLDSHFSGFTPLNYIGDGSDHQVEYVRSPFPLKCPRDSHL
jgi:hypothetical protein